MDTDRNHPGSVHTDQIGSKRTKSLKQINERFPAWVFKINLPRLPSGLDPSDDIIKAYRPLFKEETMRYLVFQLERGENGITHYQGYLYLYKKQRRQQVIKLLKNSAYLKRAYANWKKNREYCMKEGRIAGPWEYGVPPRQGKSRTISLLQAKLNAGDSELAIAKDFFSEYIRHHTGIKAYRKLLDRCRVRMWHTKLTVVYGPPRCGKTTWVIRQFSW